MAKQAGDGCNKAQKKVFIHIAGEKVTSNIIISTQRETVK